MTEMPSNTAFANGARFLRCALQVNPFEYQGRHNKQTAFKTEAEYNQAMVEGCKKAGIDVIAVTDHYRVKSSKGLVEAARAAGIWAFMGFEAYTKDGVHLLCIFDHDDLGKLDRIIGECGVRDTKAQSPIGSLDTVELLDKANEWGAVVVAAQVASDRGLLRTLTGQARANAWKSPNLLACVLPGPIEDAPEEYRAILKNKDPQYRRSRPVAVINAADVNTPEDLDRPKSSCFIKMSTISVEGLRQAFLDHESRIRLHSDTVQEPPIEIMEMSWQSGGFLGNGRVQFNPNLNALIGGRGAGKSTVIESLRYVFGLDPIGEEASKVHQAIVNHVIGGGTKLSVSVRVSEPAERHYTIERTAPNPPVVKDESGAVQNLAPGDVVPGLEIFGQHEISEFAKDPQKITKLLRRFAKQDPSLSNRRYSILLQLERTRGEIAGIRKEMAQIEEELASLPALEEMQKQFQDAGVEDKLKEKSLLLREESILSDFDGRLDAVKAIKGELKDSLPIDTAFVSSKALGGLPNADILDGLNGILQRLSADLAKAHTVLDQTCAQAEHSASEVKTRWEEQRAAIERNYEKLLRELQSNKIDGTQYIGVRKQIGRLQPMKSRMENLSLALETSESERRSQLAEWEDIKAEEYRRDSEAANRVSRRLKNQVTAKVMIGTDIGPLENLLRDEVGGNLSVIFTRLREKEQPSLGQLAQKCREGKQALIDEFRLSSASAERLAGADESTFMKMEELALPVSTQLRLNVGTEHEHEWRDLKDLSKGQQATAILLLLLLESKSPLVIDQPEDDLDNRFITEGVVPIMRQEKQRRQFLFSTHNANIPVLGDAELIVGLTVFDGKAVIPDDHHASIDSKPVKELVESILEGGETAFETRRFKYGF